MTALFAHITHLLYFLGGALLALGVRRYIPLATTFFARIGL